jgi:RimJ/RimL family protein N-acetyltransferase
VLSAATIETVRLVLTPLVAADAELMVDVLADERMHEFTGGRPLSLEALRSRYQRLESGRSPDGTEVWLNWIVRLADDLQPVGAMQATVESHRSSADVAWEVGVAYQRNGFASEAASAVVEWLIGHRVPKVQALIHPAHSSSAVVASRAGLSASDEWVDGEIVWRRITP